MHRGWWFFVEAREAQSKQRFMILRTLIGLRLLDPPARQGAPEMPLGSRAIVSICADGGQGSVALLEK